MAKLTRPDRDMPPDRTIMMSVNLIRVTVEALRRSRGVIAHAHKTLKCQAVKLPEVGTVDLEKHLAWLDTIIKELQ